LPSLCSTLSLQLAIFSHDRFVRFRRSEHEHKHGHSHHDHETPTEGAAAVDDVPASKKQALDQGPVDPMALSWNVEEADHKMEE
jgi:hypothetical protein